jgi:hypothetical protein
MPSPLALAPVALARGAYQPCGASAPHAELVSYVRKCGRPWLRRAAQP